MPSSMRQAVSPSLDIYAQAIDVLGTPLWGPAAVPVCVASGDQRFAETTFGAMATDSEGGCYIVWEDPRAFPSTGLDVYLQHLSASGDRATGWPINGLQLTSEAGDQLQASAVPDGSGGVIVVWQSGAPASAKLRASRIGSDGALAPGWVANGNAVCPTPEYQVRPVLTSDGAGGAIVAWQDGRGADIYSQHIRSDGTLDPAWDPNGVALTMATSSQINPEIIADGSGGAFVVWMDNRTAESAPDIYAQHITSSGVHATGWPSDGLALCTAARDQAFPRIVPDGTDGLITCWDDKRSLPAGTDTDIYAQRVTAGGVPLWGGDGLAVCVATGIQDTPAIAPDGFGGAVLAWRDFRSDAFGDLFAQRLGHGGELGSLVSVSRGPASTISVSMSPNPTRGPTRIAILGENTALDVVVADVKGRTVRKLAVGAMSATGRSEVEWDLRDETNRRVPPGVYWVRTQPLTDRGAAQGAVIVLR